MGVAVLLVERRQKSGGGDEFQLLHAADPPDGIAQFLQPHGRALDEKNFKRLVILQYDMLRGDHLLQITGLGL